MKILSWNVQGMGNPRTFRALRHIIRSHHPQLVFLMETKLRGNKGDKLRRDLQFECGLVVPSEGQSGGLMLLWQSGTDVVIRSYSKGHIDAMVQERD